MSFTGPERRTRDTGPPPGTPERRRRATYDNRITLGNIIQIGTLAVSVMGSAAGAIFAAGSYVQGLRDDLASQQRQVATELKSKDAQIIELLGRIAAEGKR